MVTSKQISEAKRLYELCKSGKAPDHLVKRQLIDLYNEINGTKYKRGTNCSSCLKTVFNGIKSIALTPNIEKQ